MRWTRRTRCVGSLLAGMAVLVSACSGPGSEVDESSRDATEPRVPAVFPGDEWMHAAPQELGFDAVRLEELAAEAGQGGTKCLLVVRHGQVVGEWYWQGTDASTVHQVHSVTKSYVSTLVGIAQDHGELDIDDRASDYIHEWVGTPSEDVTIRNILGRDTGLEPTPGTGSDRYARFIPAADHTADAVTLRQEHPPGTVWSLNEADVQLLDAILEEATDRSPADYAREMLLEPIGALSTTMTQEASGNTWMWSGMQSTCQDVARLGHLFLRQGSWDGTDVVSEGWVQEATAQPGQDMFPGYGLLWWLNRPGEPDREHIDPATVDRWIDDRNFAEAMSAAPDDMYWAVGAYGQLIQVHPGSDTVVVQLGEAPDLVPTPAMLLTTRIVTDALM